MTNLRLAFKYAFNDLRSKKLRSFLGIFGVMISVSLLSIILFLSDSVTASFVDYLAADAGNQDMAIYVRHYNGEPVGRSSYFKFQEVIEKVEAETNQIQSYIPRFEASGSVYIKESYDSNVLTEYEQLTTISGIDFTLENSLGFGEFLDPNTGNSMGPVSLPLYHCAIYQDFADNIKYKAGDSIKITIEITHGDKTITKTKRLVIDFIFDYNLKWPSDYRGKNLIVVDISTLQSIFGYDEFKDRCSQLIMTFKSSSQFYDIRDVKGTEIKVKQFAAGIQEALGLEEYTIDLPKLEMLGYSQIFSVGITIIFVFVSIIGMMISGILINGILNTSVEEKIREFGIFRVLGAYKNYNLAIVIIQGFLMCNIGTILGMVEAYFITDIFLLPFAENVLSSGFGLGNAGVSFSFNIVSILIAYGLGIGVGLMVSIAPALKVRRLQLIESIHPYRHEDTLYHLQKKSTVNYRLILIGLILAGNGGFVYFVIPRLIISGDMSLLSGTLLTVLLIFNIGVTLAGMGLVPIFLRALIELFRPISKKLHNIVRIFVFRYHRRNTSTVIIFAMSFSFVIFTATVLQTISAQFSLNIRLQYGSDLVIETRGWDTTRTSRGGGGGFSFFSTSPTSEETQPRTLSDSSINLAADDKYNIDPSRIMTTDFKDVLLEIDGVEKVSCLPAAPSHLTQVYSQVGKEFNVQFGDYAGLSTIGISLYGIDQEYLTTINSNYIKFTRGDQDEAFNQIFSNQGTYYCIISEAIGASLNLNLGDKVRLSIQRGDESDNYVFIIAGMASTMPGFSGRFSGSTNAANNGGVLISQDLYIHLLDVPANVYADKFFIQLSENAVQNSHQIETYIEDTYKYDYDFRVTDLEREVANNERTFSTLDSIFSLVLSATVVICLFGLISSSYSSIIERKKEIGIVRTLGLKGKDVNRLFIIEAIIIMTSSAIVGILTGWFTAWLLSSNLNLLSDTPTDIVFPLQNAITVYTLSTLSVLVGMRIILTKSRREKLVDIYRETL